MAYPYPDVATSGVVNDAVGAHPVVVASAEPRTLVAYSRKIGRQPFDFRRLDEGHVQAAATTWKLPTGEAVAGLHAGERLERANSFVPLYYDSWERYYPETRVYSIE